MKKFLVKGGIPLLILLVGGAAFRIMVASGAPPKREERPYLGPLVKGVEAPTRQVQILVEGQGTVQPSVQIDLVPQVSGAVVWKAPQLERGGFFAAGDLLVQIDPRDYELALERTRAEVAQAQFQYELARQEAEVARREWELLDAAGEPSQLVLRQPQLRAAEAAYKAAQAQLGEAHLALPFFTAGQVMAALSSLMLLQLSSMPLQISLAPGWMDTLPSEQSPVFGAVNLLAPSGRQRHFLTEMP